MYGTIMFLIILHPFKYEQAQRITSDEDIHSVLCRLGFASE